MNKKDLTKDYNLKIKKLTEYNKFYYENSSPLVSDKTYDDLKGKILKLEKKYNFLNSELSPSKVVGYKPSKNFKKVKHRVKMLSLSNVFNENDLVNFEKKIVNYLNISSDKIEYCVEPKIDGISASLTYKNGKLISGVSRGDGDEGELITENLKTISDIPSEIKDKNFPKDIDIRGEVFIKKNDFETLKEKFANPRNAASGSLRQKNSSETKKIPLKFIGYTFGFYKNNDLSKQSEFLENLNKWGFKTSKFNRVIKGTKNLIKNHNEFETKRFNLEYDVDGLVYKINDFKLQNRLGYVGNAPRWATAHKFSAHFSFSKIINIDIQVGRTGALTPVAKVAPVNIGGVVVSNATLHNEDEILRKDIRVGDTVKIERAGDVIPHVVSVDLSKRFNNSKQFKFPNKCPCGYETIKEYNETTKKYDAVRRCPDRGFDCDKMAKERLKHFVSKEALNIEGFGKRVVEKFWELKLIRYPQDIFNLNFDKIKNLDGWGKQSASNLKYSIDESKKVSLEKFIFSLGIRHIGLESAKLISNEIKSVKELFKLRKKDEFKKFLNIDGIGNTQVDSLIKFFSNKSNLNVVEALEKYIILESSTRLKDGKFKNKTFMFTGKLTNISRSEAKELIEKNSGKILSSITSKLNFLITGDKPTARKVDHAKQLNIKILSQDEWLNMLN